MLQKRWERLFDRKVKAIELRRADAFAEFTALDERYRQLHRLLADVVEREATLNNAAAAADLHLASAVPPGRRRSLSIRTPRPRRWLRCAARWSGSRDS